MRQGRGTGLWRLPREQPRQASKGAAAVQRASASARGGAARTCRDATDVCATSNVATCARTPPARAQPGEGDALRRGGATLRLRVKDGGILPFLELEVGGEVLG